MRFGFRGQSIDQTGEQGDRLLGCVAAVKPQVERDLVVPRTTRVQGGAGRRDLGEPALDRGVNVLIRRSELELGLVELALDAAQTALDGVQLRCRDQLCRGEASGMGDAAGDVVRVELVVELQR